jgi:hypothetical protein
MQQPTKQDERKIMQQLQKERETQDRKDPQWIRDYWSQSTQSDNDRIRRHLGFGLLHGNGS